MKARVALYGYPVSLSKDSDYIAEYYECTLDAASPRIFMNINCKKADKRLSERFIIETARDVSLRLITGTEEFTYLIVATLSIGDRKEKYVEARKLESDRSIDLSVLNAHALGIPAEVIVPEMPPAIIEDSMLPVISAAISGENRVVHISEDAKQLRRLMGILKYTPSYVLQRVKIDVGGKISDESFRPNVKVIFVPEAEEINEIDRYSRYLLILNDPDPLRDYVDSLLYLSKPERGEIRYVVEGATVLYLAKNYSRSKALNEIDEGVIRGFAILSKHLMPHELNVIARLALEKNLEERLLEYSKGDEKIRSTLLSIAYDRIEHKEYQYALRIAKSLFKYDPEISLLLLSDICSRREDLSEEVGKIFLRFLSGGISFDNFSEAGLSAFLYLIECTGLPDSLIKPLASSFISRVLEIYKESQRRKDSIYRKETSPTLPIILSMMFSILPLPEKIEISEEDREIIRDILEELSKDLRYTRYELKLLFEKFTSGSDTIVLAIPRDSLDEHMIDLREKISSDKEYKIYFPVPRKDRVEVFVPELEEIFDKIDKNIQELHQQVKLYMKERKRKRPKEGKREEVVEEALGVYPRVVL